jgi:hypothetical protein
MEQYKSITEYNSFFKSISLFEEDFSYDIDYFYNLLDKLLEYIKKINLRDNEDNFFNILNGKTDMRTTYIDFMTNITKFFNYSNKLIKNQAINTEKSKKILNFYIKCILSITLIYYQYQYINNLKNTLSDKEISIELFFQKFIEYNITIIQNKKFESLNKEIRKRNKTINDMLNLIHIILLINYNKLFFDDLYINYLNIFHLNDIVIDKLKAKDFGNEFIFTFIKKIIIKSYDIYKQLILPDLNYYKYITLPRYTGYCWFVSFLNGLTYSDKNRKLLNDKFKDGQIKNLLDINIETENSHTIFKSFVFYIIENITNIFRTYSNDIYDDCQILKILKKIPLIILNKMIEEIKFDISLELSVDETFINFCKKKTKENSAGLNNYLYRFFIYNKDKNDNFNFEIKKDDFILIKKFYDFLNIKCLFYL